MQTTGLAPLEEIAAPFGTVMIILDRHNGVMDIFAETDPHPEDWKMASDLVVKLCEPGMGEPDYLNGIDTWRINLKH